MQRLFVLFHSPGPRWDDAIGFLEQPGIEEHIAFMRSLAERGLMALGGPFSDDLDGLSFRETVGLASDFDSSFSAFESILASFRLR